MAALVIPLVVEKGAFLMVRALPDIRRLVLRRLAVTICTVAGGHQVVVGNLVQVLRDRLQQVIDALGRCDRRAVKAETEIAAGIGRIAAIDGEPRPGAGGMAALGGDRGPGGVWPLPGGGFSGDFLGTPGLHSRFSGGNRPR